MSRGGKRSYVFGPFRLDPAERRLWRAGRPVPLRPKVFDALTALVERRGRLVVKEELLKAVWPDQFVEEGNLNKTVSTLRQALGETPSSHLYIETVPKHGYRFVADVLEVEAGAADAARDEAVLAPPAGDGDPAPPGPAEVGGRPPAGAASGGGARQAGRRGFATVVRRGLLIVAAPALAILAYVLRPPDGYLPPDPAVRSIAVLPLENLSGDPAQEYFADGMTDALIGDLARIAGLRVISRTSSMHYKGTNKPLRQIADELKVDAVVEGTVQRSGERVLVRAQLIHAASDRHLWAEDYQRDIRDVLDLQSEIARAITREVRVKIASPEQAHLAARQPVQPKALDDYLQGRYLYWNERTAENLGRAIEHFQAVVREDPGYAPAWVGLADCYNSLGSVMFSALPPIEAHRLAEEAALKALELDPGLAEAHAALGSVKHYNWEWAAAKRELERAIELNPNYATAYVHYASYLVSLGRAEEALALLDRARGLDPFSLANSVQRGFLLENARRYPEAIEQFHRVIAANPDNYGAYWFLGHTYAAAGRLQEAVAASERAVALSDRGPAALAMLGLAYGLAGRNAEANRVLEELLALNERRYVTPAAFVNLYIGLGDKERAFAWLEKAYQDRSKMMAYLKVFPILDPLRADPRFDDLLRRVGLPP